MNLQGLCIGNIDGKNDGDKGSLYLDQLNGLPVINASQDFNKAADIWLPYASACMPYDALATLYFATASRAGQALCESFTFPFTHSDAPNYNMHHSILNHITPTDTQVHHQVMPALANDAYLIGEMHEADNGGRGYLKIYLNPSTVNGELTGTLYGGASIHYS